MASQSGVNSADSYVGSFISLISKYEIRYEGVLYHLNANDATIGLKNVRSYGTEGRKKDGPQIPSTDKVYEYILFRGSDIKDLQVKSPPSAKTEEQIHTDPAIIQSHYVSTPQSAIVGSSSSASPQWHDTPALFSRVYPGALPSYQSVTQAGQSEHSPPIQNVNSLSPSTPMNWKQYNRTSIGVSNFPQDHITVHPSSTLSHNLTMQQKIQAPVTMGLDNASECINSALASSSTTVHPKLSPSLTPVQYTSSPDFPPSVSEQASLPSQSTPLTVNMLTVSSLPSYYEDSNLNEANIVGKTGSDPKQVIPFKSGPYSTSSFSGSNLGPLFTPSPLSTPNQIGQSGQQMHSVTQKLDPVPKYMGVLTATSSSLISSPVDQAPLLPLPTSAQKSPYSTVNFTEEFDFEAMNEKFKKEEVWGSLGKAKQIDRVEGTEDYEAGHSLGDTEVHDHVPNPKPAYDKDDFFDTISCNSLNRRTRNVQNRFSERMRQDTETFGIQYRPNRGYGGFGGGRGGNFRGSYYRGRGYDYGGRRGHGGMYF